MKNDWSHADAPSGLTRGERDELAELMNQNKWSNSERQRVRELKSKLR